jgi:anaerobic dimethyl sulfoxide reductase subunit C (anchor subunit)
MLKEWPLVAFTLLGQIAVGVFLFFHAPFLVRGRLPFYGWRVAWLVTLAVVAALTALGAFVSFFHLRHPFRAWRALANLRASWLSREILFELAFIALVALTGGMIWARGPGRQFLWGLLLAAALAGVLFLLSMAKLYMLPALPVWKGPFTPLAFLSTTLAAGAVSTELIIRIVVGPGALELDLLSVAFVLVAVEILMAALAAPRHGVYGFRPGPSLRPAAGPPPFLHWGRVALLAAGQGFLAVEMASGGTAIMTEKGPSVALLLAFGLILAGEIAGRFHFYGLVARPGG